MKCGDIYLAHFPFTDGSSAKLRPIAVASITEFNVGDDFVVLPISSVPDQNDEYAIFIGDWMPGFAKTGLKQSSAIKWTKPMAIARSVVVRRLGFLPNELREEMLQKARELFTEP